MKPTLSFSRTLCFVLLSVLALPASKSSAQVLIFSDRAAFLTATAAWSSQTLDFESQTAGTTLTDPTTIEGITFSGFGSPILIIADTFEASSGVNYLGVNNAGTFNQFSYSDSFDLEFSAGNAIGLSIITAEVPGLTLFDDDIRIEVPGVGVASLDADAVNTTTPGGDRVFFIGLLDLANRFTEARLEGSGALGFFNIDDITTAAIPELSVTMTLGVFSPALLAVWWSRRASRRRH